MMHESSLYENNCFITLTYNDDHLPSDGSLRKDHFQKFMKRLRKHNQGIQGVWDEKHQKYNYPIRYFHCGEYGDENARPHYHAILFNYDFKDKQYRTTENGHPTHISEQLSELWPFGYHVIGQVSFDSAAYVARYIMKKVTGEAAAEHYQSVDKQTGELHKIIPEYTTMSRRPGIGYEWYKKYKEEVYTHDNVIVNQKKVKPPKYYDNQYEIENSKKFEIIKTNRKIDAIKYQSNNTPDRLRTRELCKMAQLTKLKRVV